MSKAPLPRTERSEHALAVPTSSTAAEARWAAPLRLSPEHPHAVRAPSPADLEPIERASRDELRALQLQRLKWSVRHAYDNVAALPRASSRRTACIRTISKSLEDLGKFPFTTKQDLRDNYPFGMFAVPREKVVRIHASSGTTGKPTVVGYTRKDIDTWADLVARSIRASGGRAGDIVHVAYGYGLFTGGLGAHYGAERLGCTVIPMSGGQTEKQVQLIQDFRPDIIMVTPSYMLALIDEMDRQGIDPVRCSLEVGIFGAEPWTQAMRVAIEQRAGLDAVDIYGLSEVMGPGVANECIESKDGPVVWEDHFYPEIIDPQTGEVLPDGSPGELVFTSLTKEALPVIRYRTRDLTTPAAADRPLHAPHRQDHRPLRRHADHPRRQRVPVADRGADLQDAGAGAALPAVRRQGRPPRHAHRARRAAAGDALCRPRHRRRRAAASHQELHRRVEPDRGGGALRDRARHRRQGQARRSTKPGRRR